MSEHARALSPTLATNEAVRLRQRRGENVVHLAFGEAGLPVHPLLRDALQQASGANSYGPVAGSTTLRSSVAGYYSRRGLVTEPPPGRGRAGKQGASLRASARSRR
jgi:aspartate/methionine/tyrosine aminotransferase